jgi:hypothetical protein
MWLESDRVGWNASEKRQKRAADIRKHADKGKLQAKLNESEREEALNINIRKRIQNASSKGCKKSHHKVDSGEKSAETGRNGQTESVTGGKR